MFCFGHVKFAISARHMKEAAEQKVGYINVELGKEVWTDD